MKTVEFPYGACECNGISCCGGVGPAAFEVTRDDKRIRVCTRCDLTSDQDKTLLVTAQDNANLFMNFDPLGCLVIIGKLNESKTGSR